MLLQMDAHDLTNVIGYSPETKGKAKNWYDAPRTPQKKEAIKEMLQQ